MKQEYEALFTPWRIGNVEIKNRIVQCSMGGTSIFGWMEPNHFDKEAANFLLERAKNNVGLILVICLYNISCLVCGIGCIVVIILSGG